VSHNDDKYLLKRVSIKMLCNFIRSLSVDVENKHLEQAEVIIKVLLDGAAVPDKYFSTEE